MWNFVKGSTFQISGAFQMNGKPIATVNWAVQAEIWTADSKTKIAVLTPQWIDASNGLILFRYALGDTSQWPSGKARIDAAATDPNGLSYVSLADFFRIVDTTLVIT